MRRILLDTHALIWALESPAQLPSHVLEVIETTENQVYISQISFFEIAIKQTLNKITLGVSLPDLYLELVNAGIELLPLKSEHIIGYTNLPFLPEHRDPFDRLIIATAYYEQLEIISSDQKFILYTEWIKIIS